MEATRHFVEVDGRRVFYRRMGRGPAVILIHGSPQSSRAVLAQAQACAAKGLCAIAPDTPGAGRSEPLQSPGPTSADYARALAAFADRLGLGRLALYGFHTGAATACTFASLFPARTAAVACDGLPAWTEGERASLLARYLPPFEPRWDGSHMTWAWSRMEEQTVFFPWYRPTADARMAYTVTPREGVHANCMDLLDAGDAYRAVYASAFTFRAQEWLPRLLAPALIASSLADPLCAHLRREPLRDRGAVFDTAAALLDACAAHLAQHPGEEAPAPVGSELRGFVPIGSEYIAWQRHGSPSAAGSDANSDSPARLRLQLHCAGGSGADFHPAAGPSLSIDLPGHGDSAEGWPQVPARLEDWADAIETACTSLELRNVDVVGAGLGAMVGNELLRRGKVNRCRELPAQIFDPAQASLGSLSLTPEWDGAHLVRAFRIARWERLFAPWNLRDPAHARRPHADLDPAAVHGRAVSLLKAHDRWLAGAAVEAAASSRACPPAR
ncbi:MAG TPA: alpha/beta hydrolase [Steroidobacteraceae bacterium]